MQQTVTLTTGQANIDEKGVIVSIDLELTDGLGNPLSLRFPTATAMQIRNLFREIDK